MYAKLTFESCLGRFEVQQDALGDLQSRVVLSGFEKIEGSDLSNDKNRRSALHHRGKDFPHDNDDVLQRKIHLLLINVCVCAHVHVFLRSYVKIQLIRVIVKMLFQLVKTSAGYISVLLTARN